MERISESLRRIQINISRESTAASFAAEPAPSIPCLICQGAGFVHPLLPSGKPDFSQVKPCDCLRQNRERERQTLLESHSNLGALAQVTFERLNPKGKAGPPEAGQAFFKAYQAAREFAAQPQGWLVLVGPSGSGKTYLAAAMATWRLSQGKPVLFVAVADFLDHLRSTFSPNSPVSYDELFQRVRTAPFLILDDFGGHFSSPWAEEKLFQVVDYRYSARLPTVITTRIPLAKLEEPFAVRLRDTELCQIYALGETQRPLAARLGVMGLELFRRMTLERFERRPNLPPEQRQNLSQAYRLAKEFAQQLEGWLVFLGDNGCGKTHLAAAIANHRLKVAEPVLFVVVPELLDYLRSTFSPESRTTYDEAFEEVKKAPLLILDDLGQHSSTPWALDKLYQLINYRYNARLPTVITSTLSLDEMEHNLGSRFSSRIGDITLSTVFQITAPDYRIDRGPSR